MYQLKLSCRVITPLFMAGADGRTPELRPSEIKGMMRWWWRAIKAEDDLEKLRREEAKIFGGTGRDEGKSKVWIRINNKKLNIGSNLKKEYQLNWKFDRDQNTLEGPHRGIGYLLYSTLLPGKERAYIKSDSEFDIVIGAYDNEMLGQGLASLWCAIFLGGFGSRSRRGGGNIKVIQNHTNCANLSFVVKGENSKEVAEWIKQNFNKALRFINPNGIGKFTFSYSNLSFSRFIISKEGKNSWIEALNEIGEIYLSFRLKNRDKLLPTGVFGLPVIHRKGRVLSKFANEEFNRRSSPLIFKVIESESKYYWMVLRLFGEFLPEGGVLYFKDKDNNTKTQKPDYSLIDDFWNELRQKGYECILNTPDELKELVEKIKNQLNPKKIIFYGSRARGDAYRKSDIDIVVETDISIENLTIINNADIVSLNKVSGELKEKIQREGVLLYERKG
ncbi:MAG: type III-B CRISPR module RAMP protein Cmr1 [Caldimicrobium sp.]|nr:type III-B CRISPR module RAMP protein Cmr1 [Caldimicrobium sp.]MCX7873931.1 type III-B CRISPR module RAMP protein Cmr1 [Caldimicrobium sp.]MDW8094076.1 type III-B CRISPR module RAMP protein Cmr1 [Caldimicrobium sp.]